MFPQEKQIHPLRKYILLKEWVTFCLVFLTTLYLSGRFPVYTKQAAEVATIPGLIALSFLLSWTISLAIETALIEKLYRYRRSAYLANIGLASVEITFMGLLIVTYKTPCSFGTTIAHSPLLDKINPVFVTQSIFVFLSLLLISNFVFLVQTAKLKRYYTPTAKLKRNSAPKPKEEEDDKLRDIRVLLD